MNYTQEILGKVYKLPSKLKFVSVINNEKILFYNMNLDSEQVINISKIVKYLK